MLHQSMNQSSSDPGFLLHISQLLVLEWIIQESYIIKMLAELSHLGPCFSKNEIGVHTAEISLILCQNYAMCHVCL